MDYSNQNFPDFSSLSSNLNQAKRDFQQNISCENCIIDDSNININPNYFKNNVKSNNQDWKFQQKDQSLIQISLLQVFSKIIASFNEGQINFLSKISYDLIKSKIENALLNIRNVNFFSTVNLIESSINIIISKKESCSKRSNLKHFLNNRDKHQKIMMHNIKSMSLMDFPDFSSKEKRSNSLSNSNHKKGMSFNPIFTILNKKESENFYSGNNAARNGLSSNEFNRLQKIVI